MKKFALHIVLYTILMFSGISVMGQFDPKATTDVYPSGTDVSNSNTDAVVVCTSCSSAPSSQVFSVNAVGGGVSDFFEWVVYGGTITGQSGTLIESSTSTVGTNNRQYLRTQGCTDGVSSITVQMDTHLPSTVWVAVRQTGEYCSLDGKWSVWLMSPDAENPVITILNADTWTNSLVVVDNDNSFDLIMSTFIDNVHSAVDAVAATSTVNVDPIPSDNCSIDETNTTIDIAGGTYDQIYAYGDHTLTSTAYDCQGNNVTTVQHLYVYNASAFSMTAPADYTFANTVCQPADALFAEELSSITNLTFPAGWTERSRRSVLNSDATFQSGCTWTRTRTYTVTLIHANNHNTYDITATQTYYYTVDTDGPTLTTTSYTVNLDASGNATITANDVIADVSDGCTGNAADITRSVTPSAFTGANLGPNTVTVTVTDQCGNPSTETATVTVLDGVAPTVVSCPANISVGNIAGTCENILTPDVPVFTDNSGVPPTVTWTTSFAVQPSSLTDCHFPVGTTTITYTATDGSGNSTQCVFTVTVNDVTYPVLANVPTNVDHLACERRNNFTFTLPTVSDNCGINSYTMTINGGTPIPISPTDGSDYAFGPSNPLSIGDNTIRFDYSDGPNSLFHNYIVHVDYCPYVIEEHSFDPTCVGYADGEIEVSSHIESGTNQLLEYSTDGVTFITMPGTLLLGLQAGTYYFRTSANVNGTITTSPNLVVTLTDPVAIGLTTITLNPETCPALNDGGIQVAVNYLLRSYTMSWTQDGAAITPADLSHLTSLDAAEYVLTVKDDIGCQITGTFNVVTNNGVDPTITNAATTILDASNSATLDVGGVACEVVVNAAHGLNPTAADGSCGADGVTLVHNYTGTAASPWSNPATLVGASFGVGTTSVTWTATDATGNTATTTYTITVTDTHNPTINDQTDKTYRYCEATRTIPLPVVSDNCEIASVTLSLTVDGTTTVDATNWWPHINAGETATTPIVFDPSKTTTVTWIVTDVNGLSTPDVYNITFTPAIQKTASFDVTDVSCSGSTDGQIVIDFTGGKPNYSITLGSVYFAMGVDGTNHPVATISSLIPSDYTLTITDADGCSYTEVLLVDEPDPITITTDSKTSNTCFESNTAALNQTVTGGNGGYTYTWAGPTYGYADGHPYTYTTTYTFAASEDQTAMPTGHYTLQVSDSKGCTQNAAYEITSDDVTAPTFTFDATYQRNTSANVPGDCGYVVQGAEFDPTVTDGCNTYIWHDYVAPPPNNALSKTTLAGTNLAPGTYNITWHVYDLSGNGTDQVVTYTITDNEFPTITCPADVTKVATTGDCSAQIYTVDDINSVFTPNGGLVSDNGCTLPVTGLKYLRSDYFSAGLDDPFDARPDPVYITWTITDAGGNSTSCQQKITVTDTEKPTMFVRGASSTSPLEVVLKGDGTVTVLPDDIDNGTTDNCTTIAAMYIYKDGTPGDNASIDFACSDMASNPQHVHLVAVDVAGNRNSTDAYIRIVDRTAPTVNTKQFDINVTTAGTTLLPTDIFASFGADNCAVAGTITLGLSLTDRGTVVSQLTYDCSSVGQRTVYLVATDPSGNSSYTPAVVTAVDKAGPIITKIWDDNSEFPLADVAGGHTVLDPNMFGTATDCAPFTMKMDPEFVDCSNKGNKNSTFPVKLTATDLYGNSTFLTINLKVRDKTPPVIVLNNNAVTLVGSAATDAFGSDFVATVTDNCSNAANLTWGIRVDPATVNNYSPSMNGVNIGAGKWIHDYWKRLTFKCDNEDPDVTIWVVALDEDGNASAEYSLHTSVHSDLTIESMKLDLCDFTAEFFPSTDYYNPAWNMWGEYDSNPATNPYNSWICDKLWDNKFKGQPKFTGIFRSSISGGDQSSLKYTWGATSGGNNIPTFGNQDNKIPCSNSWECGNNHDLGGYYGSTQDNIAEPKYTYANCFIGTQTVSLTIEDKNKCHASNTLSLYEPGGLSVSSNFTIETEACRNATETYTQPAAAGTTYSWRVESGLGASHPTGTGTSFSVTWNTTANSGQVKCTATKGGCSTYTYYNVTIHNLPTVTLAPSSGTYLCPLTNFTYNANATAGEANSTPFIYDWTYSGGTPVLHGDNYSDVTIQWDQPVPGPTGSGSVTIFITDANGCEANATANVTIGDNTFPVLNLPATMAVNNNPGDCEGAVLMMLTTPYSASTPYTYGDNCNGALTVSYRTRYRVNSSVTWPALWGAWNTSSNASGNYPVGETQVQWSVADITGNVTTKDVVITVTDSDFPRFTTSPAFFSKDAGASCTYTHSGTLWDLAAIDNCSVQKIWVTTDDGLTGESVSTLNGHPFTSSVTNVTWHARDAAGHETTHTYQVLLTDVTDPVFAFNEESVPADNANFNYEGTFAAGTGSKFYIFGKNGTSPSLSIPATITDNCSMGPVTVTVTHTDHNGSTTAAPVTLTPVADVYTLTFAPQLGQTKIVWDYNDATLNHAQRVTQYVVYANNVNFSCNAPAGWTDASAHCNPTAADFVSEDSDPVFPGWFNYLYTNNVLSYTVSQTEVLAAAPPFVGCTVNNRERTLNVTYSLMIQGTSTTQLTATGSCLQYFDYTVDNTGPVVNEVHKADLEIECGTAITNQITTWLANNAGVLPADVTDDCSGTSFSFSNNYIAGTLLGTTCGSGSVTPVIFTVTDACGQTSTYTANIRFVDTQAPIFSGAMPANTTVSCSNIPPTPDLASIVASDGCDPNPVESYSTSNNRNADGTAGTLDDNNYTIWRVWTATDACGNSAPYTQTIQVIDNTSPVWVGNLAVLAPSVTGDCNNPWITTVPTLTYTEDCDINPTYSYSSVSTRGSDPALANYYNYTITRTWSVQDNTNPAVVHTQVVTVVDNSNPVIATDAGDLTVECRGLTNLTDYSEYNTWIATHGGAVATDLCTSPLNLTWSYVAGTATDDCGITLSVPVTFTVTDPSGNHSETTATFTIADNNPPVLTGTLMPLGPFSQLTDMPLPYTTIAQIEAAGVTVTDACSPLDAGLIVSLESETIGVGTDCTYPVTRVYSITDACSHAAISTLTQTLSIKDNIKPVVEKALTLREVCATNTVDQTESVTGFALTATDVSDNCKSGQWFIDNAAAGTISYRINHTTNPTYDVPWTFGNPIDFTFHEGLTEVYYRLRDENGNVSVEKLVYKVTVNRQPAISVEVAPVTASTVGNVGESFYPLQNSTHSYSVSMLDISNLSPTAVGNTGWRIYPTGNRTTPYTAGTHYSIVVTNTLNVVTAAVSFNGTLPVGGTYDLVFTEQDAKGCSDESYITFTLGNAFDVDVTAPVDICPDQTGAINLHDVTLTSTRNYIVTLETPNYKPNWEFHFIISGNTANISSITPTGHASQNITGNQGTITVNGGTTSVTLAVTYQNTDWAEQNITIQLDGITGAFSEVDVDGDELIDNQDTHIINAMPNPGNVSGVE